MSERVEECQHRGGVLDEKKCYCELWERWTNCLEVGHCVYMAMVGES